MGEISKNTKDKNAYDVTQFPKTNTKLMEEADTVTKGSPRWVPLEKEPEEPIQSSIWIGGIISSVLSTECQPQLTVMKCTIQNLWRDEFQKFDLCMCVYGCALWMWLRCQHVSVCLWKTEQGSRLLPILLTSLLP